MKSPSTSILLCFFTFCFIAILCLQVEVAQSRTLPNDVASHGKKSKILIIGATGKFGRYVVDASIKAGHYTVALVRRSTVENDPIKAALVDKFKSDGVKIVYGDFNIDRKVIVRTIKSIDVLISCVSGLQVPDQVNITSAIVQAGRIKRFLPSEYAIDVDRLQDPVKPAADLFAAKAQIRRVTEAAGIPHTYVVANGFAGRFWPNLAQVNPPTIIPYINHVEAFGDGKSKVVATNEEDVAKYIIKTVDDPATLNKILYLRPPANIVSYNELFAMWERKSGKTLSKTYIPEQQLLEMIQTSNFPINILLGVCYSVAIKDDYMSYEIEESFGVEASERYPEVAYMTMEEYFGQILANSTITTLANKKEGGIYNI